MDSEKTLRNVDEVYFENGIFKFKITDEMIQDDNFLLNIFDKMEQANSENGVSDYLMDTLISDLGYDEYGQIVLWNNLYSGKMIPAEIQDSLLANNSRYYEQLLDSNPQCMNILYSYAITHGQNPNDFFDQFIEFKREFEESYIRECQKRASDYIIQYQEQHNSYTGRAR